MPANTSPIYSRNGSVSNNNTTGMNQLITAAAADYTGISANNSLIWTADSTNGGFVQRIILHAGGTNVAAVMRFYLNNGSTNTTATNNTLFAQVSLPATTASTTAATTEVVVQCGFAIDPGFRLYAGLGAAVAAGWVCTVIGGRY